MATYDEEILHGDRCDCTIHDIGLNCRRSFTRVSLDHEVGELVRAAFRSGFSTVDIENAFMGAFTRFRSLEQQR